MATKQDFVVSLQDHFTVSLIIFIVMLIAFSIRMAYRYGLKKAADKALPVPPAANDSALSNSSRELNSLINSLNDIIFEFNEDKVCLNVWFNEFTERVVDPRITLGHKLEDILGEERALKFNNAIDKVIKTKKAIAIEYPSDYGTGRWMTAKITPVFDRDGNYTKRISAAVSDITEQKHNADALKENEALLLEAQAIAKIGNWWFDNTNREIYWSESLFNILELDELQDGADKYEIYLKLIHPEDIASYREFLENIHLANQLQFEHRIITPRGNLKYLRTVKGEIAFKGPDLQRISGIIQDITDSKLAEKALKKGRTELVEAQTIAKIGNWSWDIVSHKLSWSDEITNIFEVEPHLVDELGLMHFLLKYVHRNDKFILQHLFKSAVAMPNYTCVFRIVTPNGPVKYLSVIVGNLLKNDDGSIRKVIGTLQDVTDRKQVEIDYKRTENKYKLVLETIKLVAVSLDAKGNIIFCNHFLADLLGYSAKEILGLNWVDNFVPPDVKEILHNFFVTNAIPSQYTNAVVCRSGEERVISWQNTISYDENGLIKETTSIGEDITDQQKATQELISAKEIAEKSSQFKSDFLSIMSHEIRTPMNAVIGTTNLLISDDPKPEQLEYLSILKFSGENLLAIINDILDYNKIEAGKLELNKLKFNIHHLTQKIKQTFYARAAEKKLAIELKVDETIPEFLCGDQMRLSQILNNLISNAVKFTIKGKINIELTAELIDSEKVIIKFIVADTGIGIAAEHLDIIFDPFMQEPMLNNNNNGGTGLGLAITKRLINLHQSDISVTSESGKGTEFTFNIEFELPQPELEETKTDKGNPMLNLLGMNVLVVDDNKMNLLIASRFLKKWQANVDEAINGQIAVDMVNAKTYDVIIMDLQMPVMNGFEATSIIKITHPQLPIIALTADAMPETYTKALAAGMSDYLTKPFVPAVFFEKISRHYKVTI